MPDRPITDEERRNALTWARSTVAVHAPGDPLRPLAAARVLLDTLAVPALSDLLEEQFYPFPTDAQAAICTRAEELERRNTWLEAALDTARARLAELDPDAVVDGEPSAAPGDSWPATLADTREAVGAAARHTIAAAHTAGTLTGDTDDRTGRRWTTDERDRLREMIAWDYTDDDMAATLHRTANGIRNERDRMRKRGEL